jgi:hypothetical protein
MALLLSSLGLLHHPVHMRGVRTIFAEMRLPRHQAERRGSNGRRHGWEAAGRVRPPSGRSTDADCACGLGGVTPAGCLLKRWGGEVGARGACSPSVWCEGGAERLCRLAWACCCHRFRIADQPSSQRSFQARLRMASMALTYSSAQRMPAPFRRLCTTSLLALSTLPLPMG